MVDIGLELTMPYWRVDPSVTRRSVSAREGDSAYLENCLQQYWVELEVLLRRIMTAPEPMSRLERLRVLVHYNIPRVLELRGRQLQSCDKSLAGNIIIASLILNHLQISGMLQPLNSRERPYPYWTIKQAMCENCQQVRGPWFWEQVPTGQPIYPNGLMLSGYRERKRVMVYGCSHCTQLEIETEPCLMRRELVLKSFACQCCGRRQQILAWEAMMFGGSPLNSMITCDDVGCRMRQPVTFCEDCGPRNSLIHPGIYCPPSVTELLRNSKSILLGSPAKVSS